MTAKKLGRKPLPPGEVKVEIKTFIKSKYVAKHGGKEKVKAKIINYIK